MLAASEKIGWNPCYRVEKLEGEGLFLLSENDKFLLRGKPYMLLAPLISAGKYSEEAIINLLADQLPLENIYYALLRLEDTGFIQAKVDFLPSESRVFCGLLGCSEKQAFERIKEAKVFLQGFGVTIDPDFRTFLMSSGIDCVDDFEKSNLAVVAAADYLMTELSDFNRKAFENGRPWMLFKPCGSQIWMGPFFHPGKTACYECLAFRLTRNRTEELYFQKKTDLQIPLFPPIGGLECIKKMAWNLAATEIFKLIISGESQALQDKIITLDTLKFAQQEHILGKRLYCLCCGVTPRAIPSPFLLTSKKKECFKGGSYRMLSAEETLAKYLSQVSPITGGVKCIKRSESLANSFIHVYLADANKAVNAIDGMQITSFRQSSSGKGVSDIEAKASCLGEAIERLSGEYQGNEHHIHGSFLELKAKAIHPNSVLLYSEQQYREKEQTNSSAHTFHKVISPLPENATISWTPVWSLTEQCYKYYPTACCYYSYSGDRHAWPARADSNGCAAGNCLEEAILQGFFELVERDSIAIWWYNRIQMPYLDLESFQIPYIKNLIDAYKQIGREVWVLDITSDLKIPVFVAISRLSSAKPERIYLGFGAHLDPSIALIRSLTEMNQMLDFAPFWEEESCDSKAQIDCLIVKHWMNHATLENQIFLQGTYQKSAQDFTVWCSDDLLEDINHCQKTVESQNMELLVLDQTRDEFGLNVVRVIVPGLRHFWPRFAPGRLYDVPVKMGLLKEPLQECKLNPIGMFL